jgi:hypothetical protein
MDRGGIYLSANKKCRLGRPLLSGIKYMTPGSKNKFLDFQLKKVDALHVYTIQDIKYVHSKLSDKTRTFDFGKRLYYIKVNENLASPRRRSVLNSVDKGNIFPALVQARGRISRGFFGESSGAKLSGELTALSAPVGILIEKGDPVLQKVADGILVQLLRRGIKADIQVLDRREAVSRAWKGEYDIIIASNHTGAGGKESAAPFFMRVFGFADVVINYNKLAAYEKDLVQRALFLPLFEMDKAVVAHEECCRIGFNMEDAWRIKR